MHRRDVFLIAVAAIALRPVRWAFGADAGQLLEIGPWTLVLPDTWKPSQQKKGVPYFESHDMSKGCYIKAIEIGAPGGSPEELAESLQSVQERVVRGGKGGAQWRVMARTGVR